MVPHDPEGDPPSSSGKLSLDAVLDVVSHHHRRNLLRMFQDSPDNAIAESEAIQSLQEQEQQRTGKQPSPDHIATTLHHVHGPKLSEVGLISYDEANGEYQYQPNDQIEKWLDHIASVHDEP